jgi:hypothetical protein
MVVVIDVHIIRQIIMIDEVVVVVVIKVAVEVIEVVAMVINLEAVLHLEQPSLTTTS